MARTDRCKALEELDTVVQGLGSCSGTSTALADRWVHSELSRAVRHDVFTRDCCRSLAHHLLSRENVHRYLNAAARDDLTVNPRRNVHAKYENSHRVRRRVLRRIASALGVTIQLPPPPPERHHPPVTPRQQQRLLAHVTAWSQVAPTSGALRDARIRLACVVALVTETAARTSELLALTVEDFALDLSTVTLTHHHGDGPAERETLPLTPTARQAVRPWLTRRADLVGRLQGSPPRQLLVSVRSGGPRRHAGMPIGPFSLREQYATAVALLNADMANTVGWTPLPRTLERLRHSTDNPGRAPQVHPAATGGNTAATAA